MNDLYSDRIKYQLKISVGGTIFPMIVEEYEVNGVESFRATKMPASPEEANNLMRILLDAVKSWSETAKTP